MTYKIELEIFEGPMDLLLHLINSAEVDIYDIPINLITEQFMKYLQRMEDLNLEVASEFLVMASTLIEIKSKMLLPKEEPEIDDEDDIDPRQELVQRLIEYKKFKAVSKELKVMEEQESKIYYKPKEDLFDEEVEIELEGLDISSLLKSINNILKTRNKEEQVLSIDEIQRQEYSLEDCMIKIEAKLSQDREFYFTELLKVKTTRAEVVAYFLSLLELIKLRIVLVKQEDYTDIKLIRREEDVEGKSEE